MVCNALLWIFLHQPSGEKAGNIIVGFLILLVLGIAFYYFRKFCSKFFVTEYRTETDLVKTVLSTRRMPLLSPEATEYYTNDIFFTFIILILVLLHLIEPFMNEYVLWGLLILNFLFWLLHWYWLFFKKYRTELAWKEVREVLVAKAKENEWVVLSFRDKYLMFQTDFEMENAKITVIFDGVDIWVNCMPCMPLHPGRRPMVSPIFWFRGEYYKEIKNTIREREKMMGKPNNQ